GEVSFDLTHGFRHLGMVGMLSAVMLERIGRLTTRSLWYGALDMTDCATGITPVLPLDALNAIQRWIAPSTVSTPAAITSSSHPCWWRTACREIRRDASKKRRST